MAIFRSGTLADPQIRAELVPQAFSFLRCSCLREPGTNCGGKESNFWATTGCEVFSLGSGTSKRR